MSLSEHVGNFLSAIYAKPEDDRTQREQLLVASGEAFLVHLRRHESRAGATHTAADKSMIEVLRSYNEINRDYDLLANDVDMAQAVRTGRRGGK